MLLDVEDAVEIIVEIAVRETEILITLHSRRIDTPFWPSCNMS